MIIKRVRVTQLVTIQVDETKFTPEFMEEFRASHYRFHSLDQHIEHLGQLAARGGLSDFTEGYGPIEEMGIRLRHDETEDVEIVE